MCIIICKKTGVEPLDEGYFERAWEHNGDGGGIVWKSPENEDAHVQKGFMKKEDMLAKIREVNKKENSFIAHFRIRSVGEVKPENTHPFVMDKITFAHNGTISSLKPLEGKTDSETFGLAFLKSRSMKWIKENQLLLELALGSSKFAIMDNKTGEILILNKELGKEQDGAWFSNSSADKPSSVPVCYHYNSRFYDDDYDDYYDHSRFNFNNSQVKARKLFGTSSFTETFAEYKKENGYWTYTTSGRPMCTYPFTDDLVVSKNGMWKINPEYQPVDYQTKKYKKRCPEYKIIANMQRSLQKDLAEYWKMSFEDTSIREDFEHDLSAQNIVLDAARRFIRNGMELDYANLYDFVFNYMNVSSWVGYAQKQKANDMIGYVSSYIDKMFGVYYN